MDIADEKTIEITSVKNVRFSERGDVHSGARFSLDTRGEKPVRSFLELARTAGKKMCHKRAFLTGTTAPLKREGIAVLFLPDFAKALDRRFTLLHYILICYTVS